MSDGSDTPTTTVDDAGAAGSPPTLVRRLRVDGQASPDHVDRPVPRYSWEVVGDGFAADRARYQVLVAAAPEDLHLGGRSIWDSGWVTTDGLNAVDHGGPPLEPLRRYHWTVRADDQAGHRSGWAPPAAFETSLLTDGAWEAPWIGAPAHEVDDQGRGSVTYLRTTFTVDEPAERVIACVSALGLYRAYCNGHRISDGELEPGWTDYTARVLYRKHELTDVVLTGDNTLDLVLADGWWAGHVGWFGRDLYGGPPAATVSLHVAGQDGGRPVVLDPAAWRARRGRVVTSDLLMGEVQDLAAFSPEAPGEGLDAWQPAVEVPAPDVRVEAPSMEPVRVLDELPAVGCTTLRDGVQLLDFGQHVAGRVRLRVNGPAGARVVVRHGEAFDPEGELYTDNLRSATQENVFVLSGTADEVLEPEFTIQGFRFAEVSGPITQLRADDASALALWSDLPQTGWFHASDPLLDRLHHNVVRTQRGNFVSVPTDCPQRDERLGWTGDIHLFADTATFNMDCRRFLGTWVRSLADGQRDDGRVYDIAPYPPMARQPDGIQIAQPGWGDAIIGVPWSLYLHYGDRGILRQHWDAMRRWMASGAGGDGLVRPAGAYRDWNSLGPTTPTELIGTAWYARAARNMTRIARALGEDTASEEYDELHTAIHDAFRREFLTPQHRLVEETQTGYALALEGGFVPAEGQAEAVTRLVALLQERDWTVTTGFIGTAALLPALTRGGRVDVAYRVVSQTAYPSWGYQVLNDATTMWEHWDTWLPGERFQDAKMNSFNHFALATVGDWLYRFVAGINPDPDAPGYRRVNLTPHPGPSLPHARARLDSVAGTITSSWWRDRDTVRFTVGLPVHSTGCFEVAWLTDATSLSVSGNGQTISGGEGAPVRVELGPGTTILTAPASAMDTGAADRRHEEA